MKKKDFENLKVGDTVHINDYKAFGYGNPERKIVYIDYDTKQVVVKVEISCIKWPNTQYVQNKLRIIHMNNIEKTKD